MHAAILKTVKDPAVAERLRKSGAEPVTTSPAEMGKQIQEDLKKYIELAKSIGLDKVVRRRPIQPASRRPAPPVRAFFMRRTGAGIGASPSPRYGPV